MPAGDRALTNDELGRSAVAGMVRLPRRPVRLVLENIRSRHNVGSIFRSADAFGIEGLDLCGFTPMPPHREIEKTALGATASVPWRHHGDGLAAVSALRTEGWTIIAVEQTLMACPLDELVLPPIARVALILGNELEGVSQGLIEACDASVILPQQGVKRSLNVSVCAGIVLWWLAGRNTGPVSIAPQGT